jgi:hypothetical protein
MKMRIAIKFDLPRQRAHSTNQQVSGRQEHGFFGSAVDRGLRRPSFLSEESSFAFGSDLLSTQ